MVAFFGKIVIGWKLQTIFTEELHHKYLAGSKYAGEAKISILISRLSLLMSRGNYADNIFLVFKKQIMLDNI